MEVQIHGSESGVQLQVRIGLTKKQYQKGLGSARKPSPRMCDKKPQTSGQLSDYSNGPVSNNICRFCSGDHNVLVISLENGDHIVTLQFPKDRAARIKSPDSMLLDNNFWWEKGDV